VTISRLFETMRQDLQYGVRSMRKNLGFSVAVVFTIALGIGANTAMFSVIHAVLLKPLEYRDPEQVVIVLESATPVRFDEIRASNRSYSGVGAFTGPEEFTLTGSVEPEVLKGVRVSGNFLEILGISPLTGRSFFPDEDKAGAPAVAMISAAFWRRRFGRDPAILGRTVTLSGVPTTIIGVLPSGFSFPSPVAEVWLNQPAEWSVLGPQARPNSPFLSVFGRLKSGVNLKQATAELGVLNAQYAAAHPDMVDAKPDSTQVVLPLKEELVSDIRPKLWLLFGAVGFVLLIVCANIGSLMLARASSRAREFAVRAAIGAGRARIIGQLLAESTLLSGLGGAIGIGLAALSLRGIRSMPFIDLPRSGEIRVDATVLSFGVILALATGVAFGILPSRSASKPDLAGVLRGSGESPITTRSSRFNPRSFLVTGQVALSIILLIGATLLIKSLAHLYRVDPGFEPRSLLTMKVSPSQVRYDTDQKRAMFYEQLVQRTESLPGVRSAAVTLTLPMADQWMGTTLQVVGKPRVEPSQRPIAIFENITPEYFRTMRIALRRGRDFTANDDKQSRLVMIINESAAHLFWPAYPGGPDPIGQRILIGNEAQPVEIAGVVADVHQTGRDSDSKAGVYFPSRQKPSTSAMLIVRTEADPLSFANAVRSQVLTLDRDQPVSDISTMEEVVDASEGQLRLMMRLLASFAGAATLLAVIGLYAVVSYSVVQRTKEIGIRRALGAARSNILSLVARQVVTLALTGVILGVGGAFVLTRLLQDLLFKVSATDPATFAGISVLFVLVALAASYIPARRAARVDPLIALRG
jgi:putative ABC transport system permease protein